MAAGRHQASWDGKDAAGRKIQPGTYFLRLEAKPHTATRKLVMVK
jgi:hypothetical protein